MISFIKVKKKSQCAAFRVKNKRKTFENSTNYKNTKSNAPPRFTKLNYTVLIYDYIIQGAHKKRCPPKQLQSAAPI